MKRLTLLIAIVLIATACGSDSDSSDTTVADSTTTTTVATTTTEDADAGDTTTTTGAATAQFVISRVVFGDDGYVSVTNVGGESGNLEGWQLCQRPAYFGIGSVEVAAGETVHFTTGDPGGNLSGQVIDSGGRFSTLNADNGEIGLYIDSSFGSAASIRSYVEWGSAGHGRSSVAVEAGIWDGGFVAAGGAPGIAATVLAPSSVGDWATS
ncbi:MAG: hypothetical protein OER12_00730 [Acidimicrobiia bacterium]|nr:hypothetical protein [Acidimicrobiia bacterium]